MAELQPIAKKKYYDPTVEKWATKIMPGEYLALDKNDDMIVTTLGSCISVCMRDTKLGVGGMNHFMLPSSDTGEWGGVTSSARYGNYAMEHLINEILKRGGNKLFLEAKIFGGGEMFGAGTASQVGNSNADFAMNYCRTEHIMVAAVDTGNDYARKVYYHPSTGKVVLKKLTMLKNDTLEKREKEYQANLSHTPIESDIELF